MCHWSTKISPNWQVSKYFPLEKEARKLYEKLMIWAEQISHFIEKLSILNFSESENESKNSADENIIQIWICLQVLQIIGILFPPCGILTFIYWPERFFVHFMCRIDVSDIKFFFRADAHIEVDNNNVVLMSFLEVYACTSCSFLIH